MRECIAKLAALMYGPRRFRRDVAGNPARKRELLKQPLHPLFIGGNVRIDLTIGALEICIRNQTWAPVSGARDVDHVEVMLLDDPVQVNVDKVKPGCRTPVTEKPWLDMVL